MVKCVGILFLYFYSDKCPQKWQLRTTQIYYLTVSVGLGADSSLTGLTQVLARAVFLSGRLQREFTALTF